GARQWSSQTIGLPIAAGAGSGKETIMSGYPTRTGAGCPTIMAAGQLSAVSAGAGCHLPGEMSTGDQVMWAGAGPAVRSGGHRWHLVRCFTDDATMAAIA